MHIIYSRTPEEADAGAPLLAVFGIAVILYAVVSISGSVLQSFGQVNKPLISLCVGGVIKCGLNAFLVGFEDINIMGAPIATCVCYVVMIAMNITFLKEYLVGCGAIFKNTAKIAVASLIMGVFAYIIYSPISGMLGVKMGGLVAIVLAALLYAVLVMLFKIVTINEIKSVIKRG